eukprot:3427472-Ditylum_brightwellii.AAC.1
METIAVDTCDSSKHNRLHHGEHQDDNQDGDFALDFVAQAGLHDGGREGPQMSSSKTELDHLSKSAVHVEKSSKVKQMCMLGWKITYL